MTFHWLMIDAGFKNEEELVTFFDVTTKTVYRNQKPWMMIETRACKLQKFP